VQAKNTAVQNQLKALLITLTSALVCDEPIGVGRDPVSRFNSSIGLWITLPLRRSCSISPLLLFSFRFLRKYLTRHASPVTATTTLTAAAAMVFSGSPGQRPNIKINRKSRSILS